MISTGRFNSRATRARIFSMSSRSPFQSQPFSLYRLIFSDSGVLTATIQLFLLNSIARRQRTVSSWAAAGGKLFTVRTSIVISYGRECETRARYHLLRPSRLHRIFVAGVADGSR